MRLRKQQLTATEAALLVDGWDSEVSYCVLGSSLLYRQCMAGRPRTTYGTAASLHSKHLLPIPLNTTTSLVSFPLNSNSHYHYGSGWNWR